MAGAKFYYSTNDSLGEVAAKSASDSSVYTTPKYVFTIHNYYADTDANYEYIAPRISTGTYGGWASHDYHAIAQDKFYYVSSSDAYESFKFVHKLSAPLLLKKTRDASWGRCQAPFEYFAIAPGQIGYGAKIYWDNSNSRIQVDVLDSAGNKDSTYLILRQGYGVFILLSGAGGGGGGGDNDVLLQGRPGGGGGGGGGTALIYFDAKEAYDYSKNSYLLISIGTGGAGGAGGSGFTAGSAGGNSVAQLKSRSGATLRTIICAGGEGGAGHAWNEAADSAGGTGGIVVTSTDNATYSTILKLLDSVSGGDGGAGKRNSDGSSGNGTASGSWTIPFEDSWKKRDNFSSGSKTYSVGAGGSNNIQGGGGGGCSAGYIDSSAKTDLHGCGMGGYGGYAGQAGAAGLNGFCGIFYNYIPATDATSGCIAKKVS